MVRRLDAERGAPAGPRRPVRHRVAPAGSGRDRSRSSVVVVARRRLAIPRLVARARRQVVLARGLGPACRSDRATRRANPGAQVRPSGPVRFLPEAEFKKLAGGAGGVDAADATRSPARPRRSGRSGSSMATSTCSKSRSRPVKRHSRLLRSQQEGDRRSRDERQLLAPGDAGPRAHHVLQDQHFDLRKIEQQAAEDDARHGGSAGADARPHRRRRQPRRGQLREGALGRPEEAVRPGAGRAREAHSARRRSMSRRSSSCCSRAPYELGPPTIRMLIADGRQPAVNKALTGPTPTSADFVQAGLVAPPPPNLPAPILAPGEKAEGTRRGVRRVRAVRHARDPRRPRGRAQRRRRDPRRSRAGTASEREVLLPRPRSRRRDVAAATFVRAALTRWATTATAPSVNRVGSSVTFTACDPGTNAVGASKERLDAAALLLAARSGSRSASAEGGVPPDAARCVARLFALSPGALDHVAASRGGGSLPPDEAAARTRARAARGADVSRQSESGLALTTSANVLGPATRRRRWSTTQISRASIRTT